MCLFDFVFEREVQEEGNEKILKSGIKVGEDNKPPKKDQNQGMNLIKQTKLTPLGLKMDELAKGSHDN